MFQVYCLIHVINILVMVIGRCTRLGIRQAKSDSSSHDSCTTFDLMTSTEAEKVTLM